MELSYWQIIISVLGGIVLILYLIRKSLGNHWSRARPDEEEPAGGKIVLITGAGSGVGFETAVEMTSRGATVIVTGRSMQAANRTIGEIRKRTFLGKLIPMELELASLDSIKRFCKEVEKSIDKLDILINNAGVTIPATNRQKTHDGFEIHFGVNHLGHFLLTNLLMPLLRKAESSRIVIVTSCTHRGCKLNFDDLMFERTEITDTSMSGNPLYRSSKLANVLFGLELAKRLQNTNVQVYLLCPGIVATNITRNLDLPWYASLVLPVIGIVFKTPNQGCQTVLHCALSKLCKEDSGQMYRNCKNWNSVKFAFPDDIFSPRLSTSYSQTDAEKLWSESERLCGLRFSM